MTDKKVRVVVEVDGKKYRAEFNRLTGETQKFVKQQKNVAASTSQLNGILKGTIGLFAVYKLGGAIKDSTLLAARTETLGVVLGVVGRNVGLTKREMLGYASSVKQMGITTEASRNTIIKMTQAGLDLTKSTELARVAQDAAVVGNINSSEALTRLLHGITTLQPEILRTIGITVTFEQEYNRLAKQLGRTADSFTQAEKKQIALNAVLRESKTIAGSYEAAMETAGKQLGSLDRHAENAQEELGKLFQPAFRAGIVTTTELLKDLTDVFRDLNILAGTADLDTLRNKLAEVERASSSRVSGAGLRSGRIDTSQSNAAASSIKNQINDLLIAEGGIVGLRLEIQLLEDQLNSLQVRRGRGGGQAAFDSAQRSLRGRIDSLEKQLAEKELSFSDSDGAGNGEAATGQQEATKASINFIKSLERQIALYDETSDAVTLRYDIENNRIKGLTAAQKDQALRLVDEIEALEQRTLATERQEEADREAAEAAQKLAEVESERIRVLKEEGLRIWEETRTAQERLAIRLEQLDLLLQQGAIDWDTYARAVFDAQTEIDNLADAGANSFERLEAATRGWGDQFTNTLADIVLTGKGGFKDLADSIIRDLVRIQIFKNITSPLFSSFGAPGFADGGVMTPKGPMPLKTYARGGVATSPQLAVFGEGSMNEAFVPLPDGKRIPVQMSGGNAPQSIKVEIENKGSDKQVASALASFDVDGAVVRVVLDDLDRGGPIDSKLSQTGRGRR